MTRIPGPIDYSGGYPPRSSSAPRRKPVRVAADTSQQEEHADDPARAAREFAREARHHRRVRRARRMRVPHEDSETADAEYSAHRRRPQPQPTDEELDLAEKERLRRRDERKSKRRRQPVWKWARRIAGVLLLVGLGELVVAVLTAPQFQVQRVDIVGADITPRVDVTRIASTLSGQNWVRAQTKPVAKRLESLPTVRDAAVKRELSWPPLLTVQIEERQPFVRIGSGEIWWVVDENGVPFRRADRRDYGLYAVTSPKLRPELGRAFSGSVWEQAALITKALEEEKQSGQSWALRRIYLDENNFVSLRLAGGANDEILIRLGEGQWEDKLARARQALDYFEQTGRRAQVLNLVSYNRPAWTPRSVNTSHSPTPPGDEASTN